MLRRPAPKRVGRPVLSVALVCLIGCATGAERRVYQLMQEGAEAERVGETARAERQIAEALAEVRGASLGAELEASIQYELGRVVGKRCRTDEARALLEASLRHAETSGASARVTLPRVLELGYLESSAGRDEEALPYLERGVATARANGFDQDVHFPDVLQAYAVALRRTGARERGDATAQEALAAIRARPPRQTPPITFAYRLGCAAVARERGDYAEVLRQHQAVLAEALLEVGRTRLVNSVYEAGRAAGVTCRFDEAETYLLDALSLDRQRSGPVHFDLVELARLKLDQRDYPGSASYFERAIEALNEIRASEGAPVAFADILDEYATTLDGTGKPSAAGAQRARARYLRSRVPGAISITDRTPYGTQCPSQP